MKRKIISLMVICLMVSVMPTALADRFSEYGWDADTAGYLAVVANPNLSDRLNLREKPDAGSKSLGRFYSGTPVYVTSRETARDKEDREWLPVNLMGNFEAGVRLEGYMLKEYLMPMNANFEAPQLFHRASVPSQTNLLYEPRNGAEIVAMAGMVFTYMRWRQQQ